MTAFGPFGPVGEPTSSLYFAKLEFRCADTYMINTVFDTDEEMFDAVKRAEERRVACLRLIANTN